MKTFFVDTNLFIRYLTNDDPAKADRVEALLDDARDGEIHLGGCPRIAFHRDQRPSGALHRPAGPRGRAESPGARASTRRTLSWPVSLIAVYRTLCST
jgi:predicted nucleic acid-binding protein